MKVDDDIIASDNTELPLPPTSSPPVADASNSNSISSGAKPGADDGRGNIGGEDPNPSDADAHLVGEGDVTHPDDDGAPPPLPLETNDNSTAMELHLSIEVTKSIETSDCVVDSISMEVCENSISPPSAAEEVKDEAAVIDRDAPDDSVGNNERDEIVVKVEKEDASKCSMQERIHEAANEAIRENPLISTIEGKPSDSNSKEIHAEDELRDMEIDAIAEMAEADEPSKEKEVVSSVDEDTANNTVMNMEPAVDTPKTSLKTSYGAPMDVIDDEVVSEAAASARNRVADTRLPSQESEKENAEHECDESDDDIQAFETLIKRTPKQRKRRRTKQGTSGKIKPIRISIPSNASNEQETAEKIEIHTVNKMNELINRYCPSDDVCLEAEDPLSFYSNMNEGQDSDCVEFKSSMTKNRLENELNKLKKAKKLDMKKIQAYISARWEERSDRLQKQINKIRFDMVSKQAQQRSQLTEKQNQQTELDCRKIVAGENWLVQKQQIEMQQTMAQHQNLANTDIMKLNSIVNELQSRHAFQRQQFEEKKTEMKKNLEQELHAQNHSILAHHNKRQAEAEVRIKELAEKCRAQQEHMKAKLMKLHEERFEAKRKQVIRESTLDSEPQPEFSAQGDTIANPMGSDNKHATCGKTAELNVDNQCVTGGPSSSDSVARQKQRKGLMNNIQLAIEIHNEGIIAITRSNQSPLMKDRKHFADKPYYGRSNGFIPWGRLSTSFLYAIVLGELPSNRLMEQMGADPGSMCGGIVKCIITDTRTSEETAVSERASALAHVQAAKCEAHVKNIDDRYANVCASMSKMQTECAQLIENVGEISAAHKEAASQLEKATQTFGKFKTQAQHFFNQGK